MPQLLDSSKRVVENEEGGNEEYVCLLINYLSSFISRKPIKDGE
jgi:hypothetical protein